ncbi:putative oxidoreductase, partial [Escherichia coli H736]
SAAERAVRHSVEQPAIRGTSGQRTGADCAA